MQTLIMFLLTLSPAQSKTMPKPVLEMSVVGHFSREVTQISKRGNVWVCKTELRSYYESSEQPFDSKMLKAIEKIAGPPRKPSSDCREQIFLIDRSSSNPTTVVACKSGYPFENFVEQVSHNCGR